MAYINRLEFHHIFPKAFLKRKGISDDKINYQANICMLNLGDNRDILDKNPSDYFEDMRINLGESFFDVLESNFISEAAYEAIKNDDYDSFIKERSNSIITYMKELTKE